MPLNGERQLGRTSSLTILGLQMSSNRNRLKSFLLVVMIATGVIAVFYYMIGPYLGPGVVDSKINIINGYEYIDAGGYEKLRLYAVSSGT